MRRAIFWLSGKKLITTPVGKTGLKLGFAKRFMAGETLAEGLEVAREINNRGMTFLLNHLGEFVSNPAEVKEAFESYRTMLQRISELKLGGAISIKPTHLGLGLDQRRCRELTGRLAAEAASYGNSIEVDMENSAYAEATVRLFEAVRRVHSNIGLALQAYLRRTEDDLERLRSLKPKIRLVKGAYLEPPDVAFQKKSEVDDNYRKLMRKLFDGDFTPAIATHDPALLAEAKQLAKTNGLANDQWEFQMIMGVQREMQTKLAGEGYGMRIYIPFGEDWVGYFMRRLSERPANFWFVAKSIFRR